MVASCSCRRYSGFCVRNQPPGRGIAGYGLAADCSRDARTQWRGVFRGCLSSGSNVVSGSRVGIAELLSFGGGTALVLLFCAHFLVVEAVFLSYARRSAARGQIKRRLAAGD